MMAGMCKEGYRAEGNKCVPIARAIAKDGGILKTNRNVRYLILVFALIFAFMFVLVPDARVSSGISLIFLGVGYAFYSTREYQEELLGLDPKKAPYSIGYALVFIVGFLIVTTFVPFLSMAFPRYPEAIGEGLRWFLICICSPVTESIFFQVCIFAFFYNFSKKHKWLFIIIASIIFSSFHLGSYIAGFYNLNAQEGWTAFTSNFSAFFTAFLFSTTAMIFALRKGVADMSKTDILFYIVFHIGLNVVSFGLAVITFVAH
jgi:hypothetical protein